MPSRRWTLLAWLVVALFGVAIAAGAMGWLDADGPLQNQDDATASSTASSTSIGSNVATPSGGDPKVLLLIGLRGRDNTLRLERSSAARQAWWDEEFLPDFFDFAANASRSRLAALIDTADSGDPTSIAIGSIDGELATLQAATSFRWHTSDPDRIAVAEPAADVMSVLVLHDLVSGETALGPAVPDGAALVSWGDWGFLFGSPFGVNVVGHDGQLRAGGPAGEAAVVVPGIGLVVSGVAPENALVAIDLETGAEVEMPWLSDAHQVLRDIVVHPETGRLAAIVSNRKTEQHRILVVDTEGVVLVELPVQDDVAPPSWTADGDALIVIREGDDGIELVQYDVASDVVAEWPMPGLEPARHQTLLVAESP